MENPHRILIIRFSSIGDIILTTSPLVTIRNSYPDSEITFLTLEDFASLLEFHPCIDRIIKISRKQSFKYHNQIAKHLKKCNFDMVFDLHNSIRSKFLSKAASRKIFTIKKPRWKRWLLFQFHYNVFPENFSVRRMYHNALIDIWKNNEKIPNTGLTLLSSEKDSAKLFLKNLGVSDQYIVIVPGAAWPNKIWPVEKYVDLINKIKTNMQVDTVLIGGKNDHICYEINRTSRMTFNIAGRTSKRQSLAVMSLAIHVVGSDTGMVHAAEAIGISATMILGPTSKETGAGTYLKASSNIEQSDLWCRPCSQNGKLKCFRSKQFCMEEIEVQKVYNSFFRT